MPKTTDSNVTSTRRSTRTRKTVKASVIEHLDDEELAKRMPPGYNPSDDSEDEYVPPSKTRKRNIVSTNSRRRKASEEASEDSDDAEDTTPAKKRKGPIVKNVKTPQSSKKTPKTKHPSPTRAVPASVKTTTTPTPSSVKKTPAAVSTKPNTNSTSPSTPTLAEKAGDVPVKNECLEVADCPMEGCTDSLELISRTVSVKPRAFFHLAGHYDDLGVEHHNLRRETDPEHKYSCPVAGCRNRRKMKYREMFTHLCSDHMQLENLMREDSNTKVHELVGLLFPTEQEEEELEKIPVRVKTEKALPQFHRQQLEDDNEDPDDPDDPDDPPPPPAPAPAKTPTARRTPAAVPVRSVAPVASKAPSVPQKVTSSIARPRVDRIMSCFLCNGPGRSSKEGRNLNTNSGLSELKYHFAVCVYQEVRNLGNLKIN